MSRLHAFRAAWLCLWAARPQYAEGAIWLYLGRRWWRLGSRPSTPLLILSAWSRWARLLAWVDHRLPWCWLPVAPVCVPLRLRLRLRRTCVTVEDDGALPH